MTANRRRLVASLVLALIALCISGMFYNLYKYTHAKSCTSLHTRSKDCIVSADGVIIGRTPQTLTSLIGQTHIEYELKFKKTDQIILLRFKDPHHDVADYSSVQLISWDGREIGFRANGQTRYIYGWYPRGVGFCLGTAIGLILASWIAFVAPARPPLWRPRTLIGKIATNAFFLLMGLAAGVAAIGIKYSIIEMHLIG